MPESVIKTELHELGFTVRSACNILHPRTKKPLPMFFVDLEPANNNNDIFAVKSLAYTRVVVEEPHKKQDIVQCQNCQAYNHTRRFCTLDPTCVKCAGPHQTAQCTKNPSQPPLCVHCRNPHPANYKGCSFYQFLKERRRNSQRTDNRTSQGQQGSSRATAQSLQPTQHPAANSSQPTGLQPGPSHQSSSHQPPAPAPASVDPPQPIEIPVPITRASYASAINSSPRLNLPRSSSIPPPPPNADFSTLQSTLTSFIGELKELISPLIEILSRFTSFLALIPRP